MHHESRPPIPAQIAHPDPEVLDLGLLPYADAYARQVACVERVLASREAGSPRRGFILLVVHPPVITVSNRPSARQHLIASPEQLARAGVEVAPTDRGGDITYHGPGQLVVYPILDLNRLNLGLHDYMRLLENAIISVCQSLGLNAIRDPTATGVWVQPSASLVPRSPPGEVSGSRSETDGGGGPTSKICAMGVRVRKWISMHGLALNVDPNMAHFDLIVPCGLAGRTVTSLRRELGPSTPTMPACKVLVSNALVNAIHTAALIADQARAQASRSS